MYYWFIVCSLIKQLKSRRMFLLLSKEEYNRRSGIFWAKAKFKKNLIVPEKVGSEEHEESQKKHFDVSFIPASMH